MVFAALLLLLPVPQNGGAAPAVGSPEKTKVAIETTSAPGAALSEAPSSEVAKAKAVTADESAKASQEDGKGSMLSASATSPAAASVALPSMPVAKASAGDAAPASAAFPVAPVKPAIVAIHETPTQRKVWYALAFAGHSGAAFDAWSTRRAISAGAGTEGNPLLRPFANSNALYAATQASPLVMDFLGKRMMTSQHTWMRKLWWLPQTAGASVSFAAGAHNVGLVH
jgi:hypothetical protein